MSKLFDLMKSKKTKLIEEQEGKIVDLTNELTELRGQVTLTEEQKKVIADLDVEIDKNQEILDKAGKVADLKSKQVIKKVTTTTNPVTVAIDKDKLATARKNLDNILKGE